MSSINHQIDNAVERMKARAAEFNSIRNIGPENTVDQLLDRAHDNLTSAQWVDSEDPEYLRNDVLDVMNLCALALAVMQS